MKNVLKPLLAFAVVVLMGCDDTSSTPHAAAAVPAPVVGTLVVSAGVQPLGVFAEAGQIKSFTTISISAVGGNVPVNGGLTVERSGSSQNEAFTSINLLDENGMQYGEPQVLDALSSRATIGGSFVIPQGTTMNFTVAGIMADDLAPYSGQVAGLTVVSVNAEGFTMSETITGAMLVMLKTNPCDGSQPALMVETSPNSPADPYAVLGGSVDQKVSVVRITAINDDILLDRLPLTVMGSTNVIRVSLWDDMVLIGAMPILASSDSTTAYLIQPMFMPAGTSRDVTIKADFSPIGIGQPGIEGATVRVDATSVGLLPVSVTTGAYVPACGTSATVGVQAFEVLRL